MIHITTGNQLDVVYTYECGEDAVLKRKVQGLKRRGKDELIPLPHPWGLLLVLADALGVPKEIMRELGELEK